MLGEPCTWHGNMNNATGKHCEYWKVRPDEAPNDICLLYFSFHDCPIVSTGQLAQVASELSGLDEQHSDLQESISARASDLKDKSRQRNDMLALLRQQSTCHGINENNMEWERQQADKRTRGKFSSGNDILRVSGKQFIRGMHGTQGQSVHNGKGGVKSESS
jgi:hypothetical protein